ncbi:zinc finger protein 860 [Lasius niger]|uniref:Zinc finger protein 860 n=1 Tax=Lasius niger TaxID=67767 RepID=A0A0J7P0P4_LASNI|nr:zinc finger protein 860 [Lasius niger]
MSRVHNRTLPQFSELRSVPNVSTSDGNVQPPNDENVQSQAVTFNPRNRCKNWTLRQIPDLTSFLQLDTWDLSLMQSLCEKQMMNVPNYSQNNPILGISSSVESAINITNGRDLPEITIYVSATVNQTTDRTSKETENRRGENRANPE